MASLYPGVRLLLMVVGLCFGLKGTQAAGAGRAFPIVSENYVIENFQRINPKLEWDPTNFLIDLSGQYANCDFIGRRGSVEVDKETPEGNSIAGYVDYTDGPHADVNEVNVYLKRVIDRWMHERQLYEQIQKAERFGCSVRPGCNGLVAVGCLFSPAASGNVPPSNHTDPKHPPANQNALAFTPEQYVVAELVTNNKWDRSHFLENLSGFETSCDMIGNADWQFTQAETYARKLGMRFLGTYGSAENRGSTQDALERILKGLKQVNRARRVGCSLIPDCKQNNGKMYVVVSCIYEED